jgi:hypothetical protein
MRWQNLFNLRHKTVMGSTLRDALFDAVQTGDEREFEAVCRANQGRILSVFKTWLTAPDGVRTDPKAIDRYGRGLIAVAHWFERNGSPQLMAVLEGEGGDNPIRRWEDAFGEADVLKAKSRFDGAIAILEKVVHEMQKCRGTAVERYLPMIQGSLGECFFRLGQLDRASEATRSALDGCLRNGDIEGVIVYTRNLAEICGERGDNAQQRYWLILTTNAMIQAGQKERSAEVRRLHGLEPTEGLISTGSMPEV